MARIKNRRKCYLINKKIQMQFSWLLVMQLVIPTVMLGALLYMINKMYLECLQRIIGESVISDPYIQNILSFSVAGIIIFLIISAFLLLFLGIRFSHHIAGPLYKLEKGMNELARGEKTQRLHFRSTDLTNGLAAKFNAILERYRQAK